MPIFAAHISVYTLLVLVWVGFCSTCLGPSQENLQTHTQDNQGLFHTINCSVALIPAHQGLSMDFRQRLVLLAVIHSILLLGLAVWSPRRVALMAVLLTVGAIILIAWQASPASVNASP